MDYTKTICGDLGVVKRGYVKRPSGVVGIGSSALGIHGYRKSDDSYWVLLDKWYKFKEEKRIKQSGRR